MSQLIPVNISVADRSFRLKIQPEDEEIVRKTIKTINEKIIEYKTNFVGKDMQDYVSMVLLWFATEQQKPTPEQTLQTESLTKLNRIEDMLDKVLQ
ncbi:MAG: cell division protein ZapA [Segetibacter sp.]|jgi:cell division protein ZapA|nr:cell division protein ZapA [Segetibacter sp.]